MTLNDLLNDPRTNNLKFIGDPSLLSKSISSVNVIDNPDVTKWFKKDEVVLTSGYFFHDDIDFAIQMISELSKSGCAALGIKVKRYLEKIPDALIEEAAKQKLALLEIPYFYAMSDVMECIFTTLHQNAIDNSLTEYTLLSNLMRLLHEKTGLNSMLQEISSFAKMPILLTNYNYQPIAYAGFSPGQQIESVILAPWEKAVMVNELTKNANRYQTLIIDHIPEQACIFFSSDRSVILCVLVEKEPLSEQLYQSIGNVLPILELEIREHSDLYHIKSDNKTKFLNILSLDQSYTPSDFIRWCEYFNFPYKLGRICVIFHLSEYDTLVQKQKNMKLLAKQLHALIYEKTNCYLCEGNGYLALFILYPPETSPSVAVTNAREYVTKWYEEIVPFLPCQLHIGVSPFTNTLQGIKQCFYLALEMAHLYQLTDMPHILVYQDQIIYHLLLEKTDEELTELVNQTIAELAEYDKDNPSHELVRTYKTYLQTHFNSTATAKQLYIHRNTFLKRLDKINSLLGIQHSAINSYSYFLGICALEILRSRQ